MHNLKQFKQLSQEFSVLFIEDNDTLRHTTKDLLEEFFYYTSVARDGKDGLDIYEEYIDTNKKYFDIVITDIRMPKMDGISLTKEIFKINKKQKILVISAYDDKKYFIELINLGVSGFIQKPLTSKQLFSTLTEVCSELAQEKEFFRFLEFSDNFKWDMKNNILYKKDLEVNLSKNEKMTLELLVSDLKQNFTGLEIFEHLNEDNPDKEFSYDSIKSLIKRLRKKVPNLINTTPELGYCINTSL